MFYRESADSWWLGVSLKVLKMCFKKDNTIQEKKMWKVSLRTKFIYYSESHKCAPQKRLEILGAREILTDQKKIKEMYGL